MIPFCVEWYQFKRLSFLPFFSPCALSPSLSPCLPASLPREGDLRVIRPLVYVREVHLRAFADSAHLPVIPENCPACFEAPKVV